MAATTGGPASSSSDAPVGNDVVALGVAAAIVIVLATILGAVELIRKILGRGISGRAA